mmetsp:Transcript_7506/g.11918  ORF Transcript_7506/g.11918 Transcript_7506/m.11918 type:complete len:416 (+) Transcript_7506:859-2106(+)
MYDHAAQVGLMRVNDDDDDTIEKREFIEAQFWRAQNMVLKLRAEGSNNDSVMERFKNFRTAGIWALRRRHPWLAVFVRPHGDFLNSQKRLAILMVLVFNAAVVSALLSGTNQEIGIIGGRGALALVAVILTFPVPFIISKLFYRPMPSRFRIKFEKSLMAEYFPMLLFLLSIMAGEQDSMEIAFEDGGEDGADDAAGGDEGDAENEAQERDDREEDDDADESDNEASDAKLRSDLEGVQAASLIGAGGTLASQAALIGTSCAFGGWVSDKAATGEGRRGAGRRENNQKSQISKGGLRKTNRSSAYSVHMDPPKRSYERNSSVFFGLTSESFKEDNKVRHDQWTLQEAVALLLCFSVVLGSGFLLGILSWKYRRSNLDAVIVTLLSWPQDFTARFIVILCIEAALSGICCCCCCCC